MIRPRGWGAAPGPLAVLLVLLLAGPAAAAGRYAPDLAWRTRTTAHFAIHYHRGLEAFAQQFGDRAEAVYTRETGRLHWEPRGRTHVVLSDQTDQANGMATVVPYDTVVLNVTPPDGDLGLELNPWDWDQMLFTHEYTHILHMDQAAGLPLGLRRVFGRMPLLFPNVFNPPWMLEGMAVREETVGTEGGRGRGALFAGILRAQGAEDGVPPISKADHYFHTWPGGRAPYLYGEAFLADLAARRGPDAPLALIPPYSDNLFPFLLAGSYYEATGEGLSDAWDAWRARVAAAARAAPGGPRGAVRLTHSGYETGGARFDPAGTALAYTESTPNDHDRIMVVAAAGGTSRELARRNGNRDLAFAPDGSYLVFSQPEFADSFRLYDDLYRADLATGKVRRLTRGARLREPDVAPDGRIVAVAAGRPGPGDTSLVLLEPGAQGPPTVLLELGREAVFAQPRFAPDGRTVAVSVWRPDAGRHIALVDAATGAYRLVTAGPSNHADSTFSPDGRYLLYTDDVGGVFDLYALDLRDGARRRVTRELGGAFAPVVAPDGAALVYTRLGAGGYDLYRMPFDPAAWEAVPDAPSADPPPPPTAPPHVPATDGPYHPYPAALPRFWIPVAYEERPDAFYGLFTLGTDPLGHHAYLLQAAADLHQRLFEGYLTYVYDRLRPSVVLNASQNLRGRLLLPGGALGGWLREREATLDLVFPVNRVERRERFILGAGVDDFGIAHLCGGCAASGLATDRVLRLGITHDDTDRYGLGISPTDGRTAALTAEVASDAWGSDRTGTVTVADWSEYLALPWRAQVAALRLTGATASGTRAVTAGGAPNVVEDAFNRDFAVRGIPDRALVGDRLGRAGLSWRFPLGLPEWAPWTLPIFFEKLFGTLFAEGAQVRVAPGHVKHVAGAGAELGTDLVAGYALSVTVRLGVARGLGDRGESQAYVRVEATLP